MVCQEQPEPIPEAKPLNLVESGNYVRLDVDPGTPKKEEHKGGVWERNKKQPVVKMLKCRYVKEHPEGEQVVAPCETFDKLYTIRNDGDDEWPETATLCYVGGDNLGF